MKQHLAFFLPSLQGGGAERVMLLLAEGFAQRGTDVDLIIGKSEGQYASQIPDNVRCIELNSTKLIFALPKLIRYLNQSKPDAILSAMPMANLLTIWAGKLSHSETKLAISEHSVISLLRADVKWRMKVLFPLITAFYRFADEIICVSKGAKADLAKTLRIDPSRITTIYNPIRKPEYTEDGERPWPFDTELPVILGIGRLSPEKDFQTLIDAFNIIRKRRDAKLVIIGEGKERKLLEKVVKANGLSGAVLLPGFVSNPYDYIRYAKVVVLTSRREGFGNVIVESMFCETPVVATDCPFGPREILEDGRYGILVPVGNVDSVASAIEQQLDQPLILGIKARANDFDLQTIISKYAEVLCID